MESPSGITRVPPYASAAAGLPGTNALRNKAVTAAKTRILIIHLESAEGPLLTGLAGARPQPDGGAVRRGAVGHVEAQPGLDAGDRAVRVRLPALVGAAGAGPADDLGAGGGALAGRVQAVVAVVDGELAGGGPG